ncbi:hypothetical protein Hanom_Chr09g00793971 [Helianthus anomalus]
MKVEFRREKGDFFIEIEEKKVDVGCQQSTVVVCACRIRVCVSVRVLAGYVFGEDDLLL